jgi:hypothetical protein
VALCASDSLSPYTTRVLAKQPNGVISPWSLALFCPYHLGLRGKLYLQVGGGKGGTWGSSRLAMVERLLNDTHRAPPRIAAQVHGAALQPAAW